jgi:hypothetical protein
MSSIFRIVLFKEERKRFKPIKTRYMIHSSIFWNEKGLLPAISQGRKKQKVFDGHNV